MERTITVKGIGKVSARPDYVVLTMNLQAHEMEYDKTMDQAALQIEQLNESLRAVGFEKESVKTANFNVRTDYSNVKNAEGGYTREFNGFICEHNLKVEFDFDSGRLTQTLAAAAKCLANPELNIRFTVKEEAAVNEKLLAAAAENAKKKAEVLCAASEVRLGRLVTIDYDWNGLNLYSPTGYALAEECMEASDVMCRSVTIEPDDINVQETVTFVWEIA